MHATPSRVWEVAAAHGANLVLLDCWQRLSESCQRCGVLFVCCAVAGPPHEPGRVLGALQDKAVVAVAAGREHALAVTADGQLYSFGGGRAVLGRPGDAGSPGLVTGSLGDQSARMVAAGEVRLASCCMCGMHACCKDCHSMRAALSS